MWKDFFYFSRSEKQGTIVLIVLIVLVILTSVGLSVYRKAQKPVYSESFEQEHNQFIASLKTSKSAKTPDQQPQRNNKSDVENQTTRWILFDPNTADSITFRRVGLPDSITKNILHHRNNGGTYHTPEDFRETLNLTEEQYNAIKPHIYISAKYRKK